MNLHLSRIGIQVWRLRSKNIDNITLIPISHQQNKGYLLVDGSLQSLGLESKKRMLLEAILSAINIQFEEMTSLQSSNTLHQATLLIALGEQAAELAITYQSPDKKVLLLPNSLGELLAKPLKKKQVWLKLLNFTSSAK